MNRKFSGILYFEKESIEFHKYNHDDDDSWDLLKCCVYGSVREFVVFFYRISFLSRSRPATATKMMMTRWEDTKNARDLLSPVSRCEQHNFNCA